MESNSYVSIVQCPICESPDVHSTMICIDHSVSNESFSIAKCNNCNFLFTSPVPGDPSPYYESNNYISHEADNKGVFGFLYKTARKIAIRNKYNLINQDHKKGSILDVGCGVGTFLHYFQNKGWQIDGVEPSDKARMAALKLTGKNIESDIYSLTSKYDVITLWHVLEHIPELNATVEHIRGLMKKTSALYVAVPNHLSYDAQYYKEYWAGYDVPRHLYHFDQESIKRLFKKHGMKIASIHPLRMDAYYVSLLSEQYKEVQGVKKLLNSIISGCKSNSYANNSGEFSSLTYKIKLK